MMHGDSLADIWTDTSDISFLIGQLYMYFFTILSICVINSTFIVIIEDGYVRSKYFNKNSWLDEDLEHDEPTHDPIMFTVPGQ